MLNKPFSLIVLIALCFSLINCSRSDVQLLGDLKNAVNKKENTDSFEDWHENLAKMNQIAFQELATADSKVVCDELNKWHTEQLVSIEEFIKSRRDLSCYSSLTDRINSYNRANVVATTRARNLSKCQEGPTKGTFGPSKAVVLNTRGGLKLVTAELPRCHIAFTFDDGPNAVYTQKILDHLGAQKVTANYFSVGQNVSRLPSLVRLMESRGQIWGNHSQTHANLPKLSNAGGLAEVRKGFNALFGVSNNSPIPPFFRFPYGAATSYLRSELNSKNVAEFFWNMDSLDWKYKNADQLYRNSLIEIEREKRGIILFHDIHSQTNAVIPRLLEDLRLANYTSVYFVAKDNLRSF